VRWLGEQAVAHDRSGQDEKSRGIAPLEAGAQDRMERKNDQSSDLLLNGARSCIHSGGTASPARCDRGSLDLPTRKGGLSRGEMGVAE
jgi:hypothetical protein